MDKDADYDHAAAVAAVQAVREIVTAGVVQRDHPTAEHLLREHLELHQGYLIFAAVTFLVRHEFEGGDPEIADRRFAYLLGRIGDLFELAGHVNGEDPALSVQSMGQIIGDLAQTADPAERDLLLAARTCLVAHHYVRQGQPPWGIQQGLDRNQMVDLNGVLALVLVDVALGFGPPAWEQVMATLLAEVEEVLRVMATARGQGVPALVSEYFTALARKEAGL